ncbi:MAG: RNA polymerase sigma factor [Bacteroidetes bacterium]|nr:RNA polymerase sigma factor [Bacteroidota bacterium]
MEHDEILMFEVKNGNLDSLVPLFDKYHVKLYNFFLRLTRNRETSEDLTQNVFSRIIAYKHTFNEQYKFKTWMYQMARNTHIDHYHKNKMYFSDFEETEQTSVKMREAIDETEKTEKHEILYEALNLLSIDEREIIELSKFQDLKYEEISKITGNSIGAIKVKVHRAVNKLRNNYFQLA